MGGLLQRLGCSHSDWMGPVSFPLVKYFEHPLMRGINLTPLIPLVKTLQRGRRGGPALQDLPLPPSQFSFLPLTLPNAELSAS